MSEFCFSISNETRISNLLFTFFIIFCSLFILSHPLYCSYFLFFYIIKLLSFLSPLIITTSLLHLAIVFQGILDDKVSLETSGSKPCFLLDTYRKVVDTLRPRLDDEGIKFSLFEELEACLVVSNTIGFNIGEGEGEEEPVEVVEAKFDGKGLQVLDIDYGELEAVPNKVEENPDEPEGAVSDKVGEIQEESLVVGGGSKAAVNRVNEDPFKFSLDHGEEYYSKVHPTNTNPEVLGSSLGSFGSMRKEKESKRTLACKIYEETQNLDEEERMDLLWQILETHDSSKGKVEKKVEKEEEKKVKSKDKKQTKKKREVESYEDDMDGQFYCLHTSKFSRGKMNFGMDKPNLAKISKASKGSGWFHQISRKAKKGMDLLWERHEIDSGKGRCNKRWGRWKKRWRRR